MGASHKWIPKDKLSIDVIHDAIGYLCGENQPRFPIKQKPQNHFIKNTDKKIQGVRRGVNCNFCGEVGHLKKNFQRREGFQKIRVENHKIKIN